MFQSAHRTRPKVAQIQRVTEETSRSAPTAVRQGLSGPRTRTTTQAAGHAQHQVAQPKPVGLRQSTVGQLGVRHPLGVRRLGAAGAVTQWRHVRASWANDGEAYRLDGVSTAVMGSMARHEEWRRRA